MAVDPYVPTRPEDAPRRSVAIPPARGWRAVRPGDLDPGEATARAGRLFGTPGPDSGYALQLAERFGDRIAVVPPETPDDAEILAAQFAMRRAGVLGRAPILADVEMGLTLFGWLGEPPADLVEWRRIAAAGVGHDYARRTSLVEAIPEWVVRHRIDDLRARMGEWRHLLGLDPPAPAAPHPPA